MCCLDWKTPVKAFLGKKPDLSYLRIFGCLAYVHIPKDQQKDKLSPKAEEIIFLGYEPGMKGYHFLHSDRAIYVATTTFVKKLFPNCLKERLKNKIDIPKPHIAPPPSDDGDNDDSESINHPPNDLDLLPFQPPTDPSPGPDNEGGSNSSHKPKTPPQCKYPAPTVEEVPDEGDLQVSDIGCRRGKLTRH